MFLLQKRNKLYFCRNKTVMKVKPCCFKGDDDLRCGFEQWRIECEFLSVGTVDGG